MTCAGGCSTRAAHEWPFAARDLLLLDRHLSEAGPHSWFAGHHSRLAGRSTLVVFCSMVAVGSSTVEVRRPSLATGGTSLGIRRPRLEVDRHGLAPARCSNPSTSTCLRDVDSYECPDGQTSCQSGVHGNRSLRDRCGWMGPFRRQRRTPCRRTAATGGSICGSVALNASRDDPLPRLDATFHDAKGSMRLRRRMPRESAHPRRISLPELSKQVLPLEHRLTARDGQKGPRPATRQSGAVDVTA